MGVDRIQAPSAVALVDDEPGLLQHAQVLRDGRPADREAVGELSYRVGRRRDTFDDLASCRVGQCRKSSILVCHRRR